MNTSNKERASTMRRRIVLAFTVAAALAGCGDNIHNAPPPNTPGKLGSGAINASSSETVAVSTSSALSSPRYTGAIDLLGYEIRTDGSSTAACTTITMYGSNSYQSTVDSFSDLTKWFSITLTTSPPALASGVNLIPVQYPMWPWGYVRFGLSGCTGSGNVTISDMRKGG